MSKYSIGVTEVQETQENASTFVNDRFNSANNYASQSWQLVQSFINDLTENVVYQDIPTANISLENIAFDGNLDISATDPTEPVISDISTGNVPVVGDIISVDLPDIVIPDFSAVLPSVSIPDSPTLDMPDVPSCELPDTQDTPQRTICDIPDAPEIEDIYIPTAPTLSIPTLEVTAPEFEIEPITTEFSYIEPVISNEFRDLIVTKLQNLIETDRDFSDLDVDISDPVIIATICADLGITVEDVSATVATEISISAPSIATSSATAITDIQDELDAAETAKWNKGKDLLEIELEKSYSQIDDDLASRGFSLPTGMQVSLRLNVRKDINNKLESYSRELVSEHVRLLVENSKTEILNILEMAKISSNENIERSRQQIAVDTDTAKLEIEQKQMLSTEKLKIADQIISADIETSKIALDQSKILSSENIERSRLEVSVGSDNAKLLLEKERLVTDYSKFVIERAISMESALIDQSDRIANRTLEVSKQTAQHAINLYNVNISAFNAEMDLYKAKAAVYESKLKESVIKLDKFKAELQAPGIAATIQGHYVDVYKTKLDAVNSSINAYRTDMEAVSIANQLRRDKLEEFKVKIEAYVAQVNSNTVKFQAYQSEIAGETSKVDLYRGQVDAYGSRINALGSSVEIEKSRALIADSINKSTVDIFSTEIEKYKAQANILSEAQRLKIEKYESQVKKYLADIEAQEILVKADISKYASDIEKYKAQAEISIKNVDINIKSAIEANKTNTAALQAGAKITAQLAASAWASVNVSASYGYSGQSGVSVSTSSSESESSTVNENHVYSHSSG